MARKLNWTKSNNEKKMSEQGFEHYDQLLTAPQSTAHNNETKEDPLSIVRRLDKKKAEKKAKQRSSSRKHYIREVRKAVEAGMAPPAPNKKLHPKTKEEIKQAPSIREWAEAQPEYANIKIKRSGSSRVKKQNTKKEMVQNKLRNQITALGKNLKGFEKKQGETWDHAIHRMLGDLALRYEQHGNKDQMRDLCASVAKRKGKASETACIRWLTTNISTLEFDIEKDDFRHKKSAKRVFNHDALIWDVKGEKAKDENAINNSWKSFIEKAKQPFDIRAVALNALKRSIKDYKGTGAHVTFDQVKAAETFCVSVGVAKEAMPEMPEKGTTTEIKKTEKAINKANKKPVTTRK